MDIVIHVAKTISTRACVPEFQNPYIPRSAPTESHAIFRPPIALPRKNVVTAIISAAIADGSRIIESEKPKVRARSAAIQ
jgi:hypothetical protein